jgi:L-Ala-D/L-Glu epimerase
MTLHSLESSELAIPFKGAFKHASAERRATQSLWIRARAQSGGEGVGEGCPREYVTGECISTALAFVERHRAGWIADLRDIHSLKDWVATHQSQIDAHPAAWTAVELALLDLFGKLQRYSVERLLDLPELTGHFQYSAVLGDGSIEQLAAQLREFLKAGFNRFKIKLSPDRRENLAKVRLLAQAGIASDAVRADANNLWHDADTCIRELKSLNYRFMALEEPLEPRDFTGLVSVAQSLNTQIILDESVTREAHLDLIPPSPGRWIVNCRVSKMGGLLRSLRLLQSAKSRSLGIIVGAHVGETSVLTRAALTLASTVGNALFAQEGAFGTHLLSHDVADPPLMFGAHGLIDVAATGLPGRAGLGLNVSGAT